MNGGSTAAPDGPRPGDLRAALTRLLYPEIALGAVFLTFALAAVSNTRAAEGLALIWPANAIAAAVLIRLRAVRWWRAGLALLLGGLVANRVSGDSWAVCFWLGVVNVAEIGAVVYLFRGPLRLPFPDISIPQAAMLTLIQGMVATGCSALAGAAVLHLLAGAEFWPTVGHWWASEALGACVFAPPIYLYSRENLMRLIRRKHVWTNLAGIPICLATTYLAIRYVPHPFVIVALAPMMAAFQIGGFGTSILSVCNSMAVVVLWMFDIRPAGLDLDSAAGLLDGLPFVAMIATTMPPIAVGLGTDARRRVARTLRSSERRFRESMEDSPLGVILLDRNGKWTFANTSLQDMLGYTQSELSQLDIQSLAHPDELQDVWQRWNQLLEQRITSYKTTRRFRRRDGSWLWVHCAVSLARDDDGVPTHFMAQVESLEERRLAEARLATEREFLRTTLDTIVDPVITADAEGRITYMNDAAVELVGRSVDEARNQRVREVLHLTLADAGTSAPDIINRCRAEKVTVRRNEPCSLQRPDGSVCYVTDTVTPVLDGDGEVSGFVKVLHDVTVSLQRTRELHHRADHDALTNLLNRAAFERRLHEAFALVQRGDYPCALIAVDLDRFKAVNDSAGHAAGDAVLRHVAAVLRRSVRPSDVVARVGGDEFALLLTDCDPLRSEEVASRLRDLLNPLLTSWEGATHATGASLGLAHSTAGFADAEEWARAADQACYESKHRGRGLLQVWRFAG
jgi:diguanylate cyclase